MSTPQGSSSTGTRIDVKDGKFIVPEDPIVPFVEGAGIGPDLWAAPVRVFGAAAARCYGGRRKIHWLEIYAGEKAQSKYGSPLPKETLAAISAHKIAIKG